MPDSFKIKPFILIHQAEVLGMLLTEYDEAETMKLFQRDSYNQGKEDGFKLGKEDGFKLGNISMLANLVKDNVITKTEAAKRLNISEADFQKLMEAPQQ